MLDPDITAQLRTHFENIVEPVELVPTLDDSRASHELRELLDELAALSDRITVTEPDDDPTLRRPSFAIRRANGDVVVRFSAVPLGHELTSLVLALLWAGGHPPKVEPETLERIRALELDEDLHLQTFMSLHCQSCPETVQSLTLLSLLHPRIHHEAIDGALFQDEVERRQVLSVPTVFAGDTQWGQGRMSVEEALAKVDTGAAAREAAALADRDPYDVLIVGGGPAGAAAAVYAARKGIRTGMVVERIGGQVLDTMAIENFVSVEYTEGPQLAAALERHIKAHEVDVIERQRATALVPAAEPGGLHTVELASGAALRARTVVLATGARWRNLGVPGEEEYRTKGVTYCPHCDGPLFKGKRVAVIGGGNSGVEAAIDLAGVVEHVTLLEFLPELRADAVLQRKLASLPNTATILNAQTTEVVGDGSKVTGLVYTDRDTGESHRLELEGVFVQIGLLPNTDWLRGSVELSDRGEIVIDDRGATSVPGVFAAGDCTTEPYKQIVVAMGGGSTAALSAFDHLIRTSAPAEEPEPALA